MDKNIKDYFKLSFIPIIGASLCCLSPLLLFVFGISSLSFAASLSDLFYYQYKWYFRLFGILLLSIFLIFYFRKKGICSLDKVKREKNQIINTILVVFFVSVIGYILFLYVIVHYLGVWLRIWN